MDRAKRVLDIAPREARDHPAMSSPELPVSAARRVLDALFPYALVVPLFGLVAFASSAAVAVAGTGGLVASFVLMLQRLAHVGAAGHGYGVIAAVVFWAALVATGAAALALFVVVATSFATAVGVILSGLIDLARLPRALPRTDHRWPKRVGAWTAAAAAAGCVALALAAHAQVGRLNGAHVFFATLVGAVLTLLALVVGYALAWRVRRPPR